jgi:hypothetical protein
LDPIDPNAKMLKALKDEIWHAKCIWRFVHCSLHFLEIMNEHFEFPP